MYQVRNIWSGFTGAPGYTNFYFDETADLDAVMDAVTDFWTGVQSALGASTVVSIDNVVANIAVADGVLLGTSNPSTFHPPVTGSGGAGTGPGPAGACLTWDTAGVILGTRVRGRTFLVPLASDAFENNGTLQNTKYAAIVAAGAALVSDADAKFGVWHRPVLGAGGEFHRATSAGCKDKAAVLRSRRD